MHALHMLIRFIHNHALSAALLACYAILVIWSRHVHHVEDARRDSWCQTELSNTNNAKAARVLRDTSESSL